MNQVLPWIRSNVVIVILGVVIVAAPVAAFYFSGRLGDAARAEAELRAQKLSQLDSLERTQVSLFIPGEEPVQFTTTVNRPLLDRYDQVLGDYRRDAAAIRDLVLRQNREGHSVLIARLFPEMPAHERDTLPREMFDRTIEAYQALLREVRAGSPPDAADLSQSLADREEQYITANLRKSARKDLTPEELADLTKELSNARLARYGDTAQGVGMYLTQRALPLPPAGLRAAATSRQLFGWQWNLWVVEDVLRALHDANVAVGGPEGAVVSNPVKRVLSLRILDGLDGGAAGAGDAGSAGGAARPGAGRRAPAFGNPMGGRPSSAPTEPTEAELMGEEPVDTSGGSGVPATPAATSDQRSLDYALSLTGRASGPAYDVRNVQLRMIASFEHLPVILDAIARRNLMTVTGMNIRAADPFAAASYGFIYGSDPVVDVTLTIETIWLREWMVPLMPQDMKDVLNIAPPTPPISS